MSSVSFNARALTGSVNEIVNSITSIQGAYNTFNTTLKGSFCKYWPSKAGADHATEYSRDIATAVNNMINTIRKQVSNVRTSAYSLARKQKESITLPEVSAKNVEAATFEETNPGTFDLKYDELSTTGGILKGDLDRILTYIKSIQTVASSPVSFGYTTEGFQVNPSVEMKKAADAAEQAIRKVQKAFESKYLQDYTDDKKATDAAAQESQYENFG